MNERMEKTIKTIKQRRKEWFDAWVAENIGVGIEYNPFLHRRVPACQEINKLEKYVRKLVKDGLDNVTINKRLQKYRDTQLCDEDIDGIREDVLIWEEEKEDDRRRAEITNKTLALKEELHKVHEDYLWNVQSKYLKIEKRMVEEHYHEYPEYMELMKKKEKYLREKEEFEAKIKSIKY